MEELKLQGGGKGWRTARGTLRIWHPGKGLLVVQVQGYGSEEFAVPCVAELDAAVAVSRPVRIFNDFGDVKNYDSQFRIKLTSRIARKRSDVSSVEALVQSRLVAMGVAVANLALGGMVHTFVHRQEFNAVLDAALKDAGIVNFSSRALIAA